jgi:ribonuclease BN (tRNA processing enzyme)
VEQVFISHAHIDHIGGFIGLLRARLSKPSTCRLYGPPGLTSHIAGMLAGILWDRIGNQGPCFEVAELQEGHLRRSRLQAGSNNLQPLPDIPVREGVIYDCEDYRVRAVVLDHRTPVLAYAFEPRSQVNICGEALKALRFSPGPWLKTLKTAYLNHQGSQLIVLPDGQQQTVERLAQQLLRRSDGDKLVYATDLADTAENRNKLIALASGAHTLFCEATFASDDRQRAKETGHLTTSVCAEIAAAARVGQLVPFHFSRRYEKEPDRLYREIETAFSRCSRYG